jgi:hypothetical protein
MVEPKEALKRPPKLAPGGMSCIMFPEYKHGFFIQPVGHPKKFDFVPESLKHKNVK